MFKINYNLKGLISIFLFMLISTLTFGQAENDPSKFVPNIIPPSPTAYGLGTYGNTPVGLFTGSQNINIPIYTYKTANLEVPISMFYSSNGVKVDEISSNVGQSWNLSFGGVITRIVRDKPDEERGEYPIPISMTEEMGRYSPQALEFYQYIGENDVDTEADLFSFNFGKYSGKFVFDNEGGIILMPAQEIQIQCTNSSNGFDFIVITPDGIKYFFEEKEITTQRIIGGGHSIPNMVVSSWYLSKIVHPKGDEIYFVYDDVQSEYISSQSQTLKMLSPRIQYDAAGNLETYSQSLSLIYDHKIFLSGKNITAIRSKNPAHGEIIFTYLANSSADVTAGNKKIDQITIKDKSGAEIDRINFNYTTTNNKRVFLDKIQFKDVNQNYQFEYEDKESFPSRLSFSQDHWGYYNGKSNVNLVPKKEASAAFDASNYNGADKEPSEYHAKLGLLNKITYPTKGYTTFEYESNTYYGDTKKYPNRIYRNVSAVTADSLQNKTSTSKFRSEIAQNVPFTAGVSFQCPPDSEIITDKNQAYISVYDDTSKKYVSLMRSDNNYVVSNGSSYTITPNTDILARTLYFRTEAGHDYIITLKAVAICTSSSLSYNYLPEGITIVPGNIITGGVRVKRIYDYSLNKSEPVIKRFHYARKNDLNKSTASIGADPYYIDNYRVDRWLVPPGPGEYAVTTSTYYLNMSSSSIVPLYDTGNSNVFYNYVTISYGNDNFLKGGEEHEFIVHRDGADGFIIGNYNIRNTPLTNLGWDNGLLKRIDYFNKDLKTVKETINFYEEQSAFRKEVINYSSRKNFERLASAPVNYQCTEADLTKVTEFRTCTTNHKHASGGSLINNLSGGVKKDHDCIAPGHHNVTQYLQHPCYGEVLPKTISNITNIENLSIVSYKNISFWHYLKSVKEIIYDVNGSNPVTTTTSYNYRGNNHVLLYSQVTDNSKNEVVENRYLYAKDPEMTNRPLVKELIANEMIGIPLDTQIYKGGIKISEQLTVYDKSPSTSDLLLPKSIYTAKFPNSLPEILNVGSLEKKITFDQYDDKGNIIQYSIDGSIPTVIIWGYNKTQPIAKIENAVYSDVSGYVSNLQTKSDTGTEADLLTNLNNLRNALPAAMVTTYTYLPLIGISTITDPKGNTTTYSYDEFNRLKTVKDGQGNIVSENQYHYKK